MQYKAREEEPISFLPTSLSYKASKAALNMRELPQV